MKGRKCKRTIDLDLLHSLFLHKQLGGFKPIKDDDISLKPIARIEKIEGLLPKNMLSTKSTRQLQFSFNKFKN